MCTRAAAILTIRRLRFKAEAAAPLRLTLTDQWISLSAILAKAVDGAIAAQDLQVAATQQLDLAQYGLSTLVDELAAVMPMPGRRDGGATLHLFANGSESAADAGSASRRGQALAA